MDGGELELGGEELGGDVGGGEDCCSDLQACNSKVTRDITVKWLINLIIITDYLTISEAIAVVTALVIAVSDCYPR